MKEERGDGAWQRLPDDCRSWEWAKRKSSEGSDSEMSVGQASKGLLGEEEEPECAVVIDKKPMEGVKKGQSGSETQAGRGELGQEADRKRLPWPGRPTSTHRRDRAGFGSDNQNCEE